MADANIQAAGEKVKAAKRSLKKGVRFDEFGGPAKVKSSFFLFSDDVRPQITEDIRKNLKEGEKFNVSLVAAKIGAQWKTIDAAKKKAYEEKAAQLKAKYEADLAAWKTTDEYKKYIKENASHKKKQADKKALVAAKANGMPKKPMTGYFLFGNECRDEVRAELEKKGEKYSIVSAAGIVKAKWAALGEVGQKKYQDQAIADKAKYEEEMKAWELTDAGKEYAKAKKNAAKRKASNSKGPKAKRAKKDGEEVEEDDEEAVEESVEDEEGEEEVEGEEEAEE